jgi:hypothetical protein
MSGPGPAELPGKIDKIVDTFNKTNVVNQDDAKKLADLATESKTLKPEIEKLDASKKEIATQTKDKLASLKGEVDHWHADEDGEIGHADVSTALEDLKKEVDAAHTEAEKKDRELNPAAPAGPQKTVSDIVDQAAEPAGTGTMDKAMSGFNKVMRMFKRNFAVIVDKGIEMWKNVRKMMGATPDEEKQANMITNWYRDTFGNAVLLGKVRELLKDQPKDVVLVEGKKDNAAIARLRSEHAKQVTKSAKEAMGLGADAAVPADRTDEYKEQRAAAEKTTTLEGFTAEKVMTYSKKLTAPANKYLVFTLSAVVNNEKPEERASNPDTAA